MFKKMRKLAIRKEVRCFRRPAIRCQDEGELRNKVLGWYWVTLTCNSISSLVES